MVTTVCIQVEQVSSELLQFSVCYSVFRTTILVHYKLHLYILYAHPQLQRPYIDYYCKSPIPLRLSVVPLTIRISEARGQGPSYTVFPKSPPLIQIRFLAFFTSFRDRFQIKLPTTIIFVCLTDSTRFVPEARACEQRAIIECKFL